MKEKYFCVGCAKTWELNETEFWVEVHTGQMASFYKCEDCQKKDLNTQEVSE